MSRPPSAPGAPSAPGEPRSEFRRLDESAEQSPLERFCALLADHGVEFEVDLCYRRTSDNLERKRLREQEGLR